MPLAPSVGVVVANHNNAAFVGRALASVARQGYRDLDVVVVDDASTDGSDGEIRRCLAGLDDPRFRYVRLAANLGQAGAVRHGLAMLDTPFVAFLDSDDCWYDSFVARHLAAHLNADFPVALTYCDAHVVDAGDRLLAGTAWWFDWAWPNASRQLDPALVPRVVAATGELAFAADPRLTFHEGWSADGATNTMSSMMFRRSFVDLVLAAPDRELRLYLDYYLSSLACLLTGSIAVHEALYAYRMHGRNRHSNAAVLGGTYSTSTNDWSPIRDHVLGLVLRTLDDEAAAIRRAVGDFRHAAARRLVAEALGEGARRWTIASALRLLAAIVGKVAGRSAAETAETGERKLPDRAAP